ncbi:LEA type 2 family protein [Chitinophaga horti]|uniref:LEA type 2 family protein n=1 Tax=Chitinophaga horti TaxID=2920382 RepID=A0ABY6J4G7_9BACT|nr:LEA type 2 family protein [Chitinophaga horti]UYQ94261.1 LEA type 2 family protein [Chitinophaga horti]
MKHTRLLIVVLAAWASMSSCEKMKDLEFINVANFGLDNLGFTKSVVRMSIAYYNPNGFNLKLKEADFDLFLNDVKVGHSSQDTLIYIPAKDTFYFPVKMEVDMSNVFKNALTALVSKEVTIKASGKCKVGKGGVFLPFPIKCETKQQLGLF